MRPIQINQKSWHFVLATRYGRLNTERGVYSCQYIRRCLLGLFGAASLALIAGLFLSSWLTFVFALASSGPLIFERLPMWMRLLCFVPAVVAGIASIAFACLMLGKFIAPKLGRYAAKRYEIRYERRRHKQPSPLKRLYRSWKDKLCVQLEFTLPVKGVEVETDE